jgi:hypothetical protein
MNNIKPIKRTSSTSIYNFKKESNELNQSKRIQYISINYLLKMILSEDEKLMKISKNDQFDYTRFTLYFIQHHNQFIETSILIGKIKSIYEYYTKKEGKKYNYY